MCADEFFRFPPLFKPCPRCGLTSNAIGFRGISFAETVNEDGVQFWILAFAGNVYLIVPDEKYELLWSVVITVGVLRHSRSRQKPCPSGFSSRVETISARHSANTADCVSLTSSQNSVFNVRQIKWVFLATSLPWVWPPAWLLWVWLLSASIDLSRQESAAAVSWIVRQSVLNVCRRCADQTRQICWQSLTICAPKKVILARGGVHRKGAKPSRTQGAFLGLSGHG